MLDMPSSQFHNLHDVPPAETSSVAWETWRGLGCVTAHVNGRLTVDPASVETQCVVYLCSVRRPHWGLNGTVEPSNIVQSESEPNGRCARNPCRNAILQSLPGFLLLGALRISSVERKPFKLDRPCPGQGHNPHIMLGKPRIASLDKFALHPCVKQWALLSCTSPLVLRHCGRQQTMRRQRRRSAL